MYDILVAIKRTTVMHNTIDYAKSPAPAFDAVEDVRNWFGAKYDTIAQELSKVTNCAQFALYCSLAGIQGFPVKAWYEHFHGQGSWKQEQVDAV